MPNYCSNKVTLCGDAATVYEMAVFLREQDSPFSFNKVTPLPEALESAQSGSDEQYYKVKYGDWKEVASFGYLTAQGFSFETRDALLQYLKEVRPSVNIDAIADRYHENMTKYGHMSWYSWCVENWGTKWNAGSVSCDTTVGNMELLASAQDTSPVEITYTFDTAWSPPTPVIAKLSEMYPTVSITHSYIEEGYVFAGEVMYQAGEVVSSNETESADEMFEISDWHRSFKSDDDEEDYESDESDESDKNSDDSKDEDPETNTSGEK